MTGACRQRAPAVIVGLLLLAGLGCVLSGCAATFRAESRRPIEDAALEVFVRADGNRYRSAKIGIFSFSAPSYAAAAEYELATIYWQEILRSGLFKQVVLIPHRVESDGEAIWWGRRERCDLIMMPQIVHMIDGSGALTNRLEVGVRILDTRSGQLLWAFRQKASSNPGPDIDLYWTTIAGQSAQGYRNLARLLARQTPQALLPPPPPEERVKRSGSAQTFNKQINTQSHGA